MYAEVFGIDFPLTQSQPNESTQGTHRTPRAPRSTRLTPPAPVPTVDKANEMILQDTLQVSLTEHKSQEEQEARENVKLVNEHLASVEIEKMVEGPENVIDDSSIPRNDDQNIPETRLEPRSDKESPEVEITNDEEVEITNVVIPVNVNKEEEEITDEVPKTTCRTSAVRPRDQDDPHDDAHPEGENSAKRNQEQTDDFDFWTKSYALDDDEILTKQVSQDIIEEVSLTINEAELKKIADEMLRQICTSGDEHQYHIDQMKNFLKSDIRDPEAPALSLINQDLLYLKKGSLWPEKIVLSLYKFSAIIFNDVDIEERISRWPGKPKEVVYSNLKIIQVIKTYWELGHEHKFITEIVARRANECIVSITEPDYKNLNKNDIEDMYLLIMNGKVPDYIETGLLWSLSVFIRSSVIWERVYDFQLGIESYQHKVNLNAPTISFPRIEKHKCSPSSMSPVLEGLKSYNNDVKYGYIQRDLNEDKVEYLKSFEEEIEVSQPDEKMGDVCEWKTTWTTKGTPRIIDP
ncbi:hypothetical protein Tco_0065663 [Tanacetum coccineum]